MRFGTPATVNDHTANDIGDNGAAWRISHRSRLCAACRYAQGKRGGPDGMRSSSRSLRSERRIETLKIEFPGENGGTDIYEDQHLCVVLTLFVAVGGLLTLGSQAACRKRSESALVGNPAGDRRAGRERESDRLDRKSTRAAIESAILTLTLPEGIETIRVTESLEQRTPLRPKEAKRYSWTVKASRPGTFCVSSRSDGPQWERKTAANALRSGQARSAA